jgi:hypothetical protein
MFFFPTTPTDSGLKISFEISNEDGATWSEERLVFLEGALKAFSSKTPTRREARFLVSETEHTIVYACKQGGDFAFVVGHGSKQQH